MFEMESTLALVSLGCALLLIEAVSPLQRAGELGMGILVGTFAGHFFPHHFWTAFSVAFVLALSFSTWILQNLKKLVYGFSAPSITASSLIGGRGMVVEPIDTAHDTGTVEIEGDIWKAKSAHLIGQGSEVCIEKIESGWVIVEEEHHKH